MKNDLSFDVVVIGGGHAGCEAAAASARRFEASCFFSRASRMDSVSPIAISPVETKRKDTKTKKRE